MFGRKSKTYLAWRKLERYYAALPDRSGAANLGSSVSKADFDYSLWDAEGICLAGEPQTLYYDEQMLRQFSEKLRKGANIYICLFFFSFLVEFYEADRANYKYYFFLDRNRIRGYRRGKEFLLKSFPGLLDASLAKEEIRGFLKSCLNVFRKRQSLAGETALISGRESDREAAKRWIRLWNEEFGWDADPKLTEEQMRTADRVFEILKRLVEYCREKEFRPILVVAPVSRYMKEALPHETIQMCFWQYIERLAGQGCEVVDFYHSGLFPDETCFEDALRLSAKGRRVFNEYLRKGESGQCTNIH
jgi:hypothetical protein